MPVNGHGADLYPWRNDGPPVPPTSPNDAITIEIGGDDVPPPKLDAKTGALLSELPGGSLLVDFGGGGGKSSKSGPADHDANLAEYLDDVELARISADLLDGIDADLQSRADWVKRVADGEKHLALNIEAPGSPSAAAGTAVEGQSTVRTPMMLDAIMRFQANASGELLPAEGPVKVMNSTPPKSMKQQLLSTTGLTSPPDPSDNDADVLELLMNHYLTVVDRPYYPDTKKMFFKQGYAGCGFKKVYRCPILRRPVSRAIAAEDVIVSNDEVCLQECGRVTHRIMMRQSVFKRMVKEKQYIDADVGTPIPPAPDPIARAEDAIAGISPINFRPADYKHTIYETYAELELEGVADSDDAGFALPYRVTLDKDSQKVVEIRRNWEEGDQRYIGLMPIVKYPFVEGMGFYGIGLLNIMGNATAAVTVIWRLAMDCGGFASWPGFLYADTVGRQDSMQMRVGMGSGIKVNTNGQAIHDAIMAIPYKDVTAGLLQIMNTIAEEGRRVGGTPELMVGEGRQDVPVGTTLAMLDQAVKVIDSVHKGMHIAQAEEHGLLRDQFKKDPDALICGAPAGMSIDREQVIRALNNCLLSPQADPNTPSHTIRVMKAVALIQLVQMDPKQWKIPDVYRRVAQMVGLGSVDELLAPPQTGTAPDPKIMAAMAKAQIDMAKLADNEKDRESKLKITQIQEIMKLALEQMQMQDRREQRQSSEFLGMEGERTERLKLEAGALIHPESTGIAQHFASQLPVGQPPGYPMPPIPRMPPGAGAPPGRVI